MPRYIEVRVKHPTTLENGLTKRVVSVLLVDAQSFTEAEAKTIKAAELDADCTVSAVKKSHIQEVFTHTDPVVDPFWEVVAEFITLDEKTAKEKRTATRYLVEGSELEPTLKFFHREMQGTMADYEVVSISKSKISRLVMQDGAIYPDAL